MLKMQFKNEDVRALQRRQPQQLRAEKTKSRIVESAIAILETEGIKSFSIRQVAQAAKVSVGSVYEYFPSRQALLFWVAEQRLKERLVIFDAVLTELHLFASLHDLVDAYIHALRDADLYSRLDLEIRVAQEQDAQLSKYTEHYKEELTKRYIKVWRHYGSKLKKRQLILIANYAHEIDLVSMKLQLALSDSETISVRYITQQLVQVLGSIALQPSSSEFN